MLQLDLCSSFLVEVEPLGKEGSIRACKGGKQEGSSDRRLYRGSHRAVMECSLWRSVRLPCMQAAKQGLLVRCVPLTVGAALLGRSSLLLLLLRGSCGLGCLAQVPADKLGGSFCRDVQPGCKEGGVQACNGGEGSGGQRDR